MKIKIFLVLLTASLLAACGDSGQGTGLTDQEGNTIQVGDSFLALAEDLNVQQADQMAAELAVNDIPDHHRYVVTRQKMADLLVDIDTSIPVYSSASLTIEEVGQELNVEVVNPENFTMVDETTFESAVLNTGIDNMTVRVAAPSPVTGEGGLAGFYVILENLGLGNPEAYQMTNDQLLLSSRLGESTSYALIDLNRFFAQLRLAINQALAQNPDFNDNDLQRILSDWSTDYGFRFKADDRTAILSYLRKYVDLSPELEVSDEQLENFINDHPASHSDDDQGRDTGTAASQHFVYQLRDDELAVMGYMMRLLADDPEARFKLSKMINDGVVGFSYWEEKAYYEIGNLNVYNTFPIKVTGDQVITDRFTDPGKQHLSTAEAIQEPFENPESMKIYSYADLVAFADRTGLTREDIQIFINNSQGN
ncbi:hypothetical protein AWM75_05475 [Aerococcus urinaehominis]|uniref:Uncharacterized protein n=1 Tax=Aerococcus urinaehominis TaxID=128944 RepID=A0A0X8FLF1_9LACT|nr:DUF1002 domain-containing protein [Aerococcus urinaehominis]AMB99478.1 hypothetical protein AWM75_05475 [Aerococcus urinaehominis]SDM27034.1 Uncharacterized protein YpuA, DUF1002 family [Aerococcus urinaehominis]